MAEYTEAELVQEFSNEMVGKLRRRKARYGNQGWRKKELDELLTGLIDELEELEGALYSKSDEDVRDEALDVANYAFFIYDKLGGKDGKRKV